MPAIVFCSASTPVSASWVTCSESFAVSLAFVSTWPIERSISEIDDEVSSVEA